MDEQSKNHGNTGSNNHDGNNESHHDTRNPILKFYDKHYKNLLIFSILLLVLSIGAVAYKYATTGDFVDKGITLKGGLKITVETPKTIDTDSLMISLQKQFPKSDISVTAVGGSGAIKNYEVESSDLTEADLVSALKIQLPDLAPSPTSSIDKYSTSIDGPSLGASFFTQTLKALFIAFLFMSLVVYIYFGESTKIKFLTAGLSIVAALVMFYATSTLLYILPILILAGLCVIYFRDNIPSFGIMLCAFSDVFFSLAVFNIVGLKLNTAGVAAFLMLVGYSIDTDILLAVRVLKRKEGTVFERTMGAMKTGMMMSISALIAVLTGYFVSNSSIIKEIMFILAVGLVGDIIFTWIQNAGILRWHLDKKGWR